MRESRTWIRLVGLALAMIVAVAVIAGCGGSGDDATSDDGSEAKTLNVGAVLNYSFPLHVDWQKEMEALVPSINEAGGVDVGGEKYMIELLIEDSKSNAETARAAVEKLVNQDKVDVILGDETVDGWLSVTERAGVLVIANTPTPGILSPDIKMAFNAGYFNTQAPIIWDWFAANFPDVKSVAGAYIDAAQGQAEAGKLEQLAGAFGKEITTIEFYPDGTQDFSAIATKIAAGNPDSFTTQGGGPVADSQLFKSMGAAGWGGQLFNTVPLSPDQIAKVISLDDVQGLVGAIAAIDSDDPPPTAQELKDVYVAKYGEWTNADVGFISTLYCLLGALEAAGSVDPQDLADTIGSGLTFQTANGEAQMINRPDLGNDRTIDCVYETRVGQIEGDKATLLATIPIAEGEASARILFSKGQ